MHRFKKLSIKLRGLCNVDMIIFYMKIVLRIEILNTKTIWEDNDYDIF